MADYSLVCPFLNPDPLFAFGVEFGLLYAEMRKGEPIAGYFCRKNQEQILLAANRLGWSVTECRPHDKDWFWIEMEPPEE